MWCVCVCVCVSVAYAQRCAIAKFRGHEFRKPLRCECVEEVEVRWRWAREEKRQNQQAQRPTSCRRREGEEEEEREGGECEHVREEMTSVGGEEKGGEDVGGQQSVTPAHAHTHTHTHSLIHRHTRTHTRGLVSLLLSLSPRGGRVFFGVEGGVGEGGVVGKVKGGG